MADSTGKRRHYSDVGGLTEFDLMRIRKEGNIADEHLKNLTPYFEKIRASLHAKWEEAKPTDEETHKILRYQLESLLSLQRLMSLDVSRGKQAAKKLEGKKDG
jgi:hypothetical protein